MAFLDMIREVHGSVPKIPIRFCKTLINRAWRDVRRQNMWSFQLFDSNWTTPAQINTGTVTTTQGSTSVIVDAAAGAALNAAPLGPPTPLIQRQFRIGVGTIYNIWAWDNPTLTLTLDRPFQEPSVSGSAYRVYQCYYPTPMADFLLWISIRNMVSNIWLNTDKNRGLLDALDRQRLTFMLPSEVVYYSRDLNPLSPTFNYPLYEMWGHPLSRLTYQLYGVRRGSDLVADTDTLPSNIGEDCVLALSRKYAYEWAEANKGDSPRNAGPDFRFLIGEAKGDYDRLFRQYRKDDREIVDNWFMIRKMSVYGKYFAYYSSIAGVAFPGA